MTHSTIHTGSTVSALKTAQQRANERQRKQVIRRLKMGEFWIGDYSTELHHGEFGTHRNIDAGIPSSEG